MTGECGDHGRAVVIGAGPAGLAAALTLARAGRPVLILERGPAAGGLSSSFEHDGITLDFGPHFYTAGRPGVQELWDEVLGDEQVYLRRRTRMYWQGHFFAFPPRLGDFVRELGPVATARLAGSLLGARLGPKGAPRDLAESLGRRFGPRLFAACFRAYIEKLFGVPCERLSPRWQPGRLRDGSALSMIRAGLFGSGDGLIPYPRRGSRQFYDGLLARAVDAGAVAHLGTEVVALEHDGRRIRRVIARTVATGATHDIDLGGPDGHLFSSMPADLLLSRLSPAVEAPRPSAGAGAAARNTVLVYLIVRGRDLFDDHCLYINDPTIAAGRIANFANWSPDLCPDPSLSPICCEYWCDHGDDTWAATDNDLVSRARLDLVRLGLLRGQPVVSTRVIRLPRTHPIPTIEPPANLLEPLARFTNLTPIGRAGSYSYQDQDDAILMGLAAARALLERLPAEAVA